MPTTIGGKEVATTGSGHVSPGPPATSMIPPTPPAGPVPAVFVYVARSATATATSSKLTVGGDPVLVVESSMNVEQPGNQPSQPTGGDVVTHAVVGKAATFTGADKVKAEGKKVCCTGDSTYLNVPTPSGKVAQSTGKLIAAADYNAAGANYAAMAAKPVGLVDPVSVATGEVLDDDVDLQLFGRIRVAWKRMYASGRCDERTSLGRGGWRHALDQRITLEADRIALENDTGRIVYFPLIEPRESAFVRARRLELTRAGDGSFTVESLDTRLTRIFTPLVPGGPALLTTIRDAWGNAVTLAYEGERLALVTDPAGRELRIAHDDAGRITLVEAWARGAAQQAVRYTYSPEDELESVENALGHALRYAYDGRHRLLKKTLPNGLSFNYRYDPDSGRCVRAFGDGGLHAADLEYDTAKGTTVATNTPRPKAFSWSKDGAVTGDRSADGSLAHDIEYDDDLLVLVEKNAAGEALTYTYDERGNRTSMTDAAGTTTTWEYEDDLQIRRTAPGDLVTTYEYDPRGALARVTYPSGGGYSLAYDGRGRLTAVYDPDGLHASFEYDPEDNVARERDAYGNAAEYAYDPLGRPTGRTDALGRATRRDYDELGRSIGTVFADGGRTSRAYDSMGKVIREEDALGRVTERTYAGTGMLVREVQPDGQAWEVGYDKLERLRKVVNPRREAWEFSFNRAGRTREERTYDGRVLTYAYGKNGKLSRVERDDGTYRSLAYDAGGQIVEEGSTHGSRIFERNELGAVLKAAAHEVSGPVEVVLERDALNRVVLETQNGHAIRHEYDDRNRRVARILPGGHVTRYVYDARGACASVQHGDATVCFERDILGREVGRRLEGSGVRVSRAYDARDRLVAQEARTSAPGGGDVMVVNRRFGYDLAGRMTAVADARFGTTRYAYDATGQLVDVARDRGREVFDYDAAGSLAGVRREPTEQPAPWAIRPGNVLAQTPEHDYEHDESRRRRRKIRRENGETTEYLWDCRDQLREVRPPSGERIVLTYDAFGRRVRKIVEPPLPRPEDISKDLPAPRVVDYLWDGHLLAAEIDSERGTRVFVHEPDSFVPLLQIEGGEALLYINDPLGVPKELIDERGQVAWAAAHSAWGSILEVRREGRSQDARPIDTPFRLLGQFHDPDTGLCHARFRVFDPDTARWISPDPLGLAGGRNPAAFNGAPTVHTDPYGLTCVVGVPAFDGFLANAMNIPPKAGYYDVIVHGSHDAVWIKDANENWRSMTPQELADMIRRQPDYVPGTPIRLLACETGQVPNGFAQQLSNEMGVPTQGASQLIWAWPNGATVIAPVIPGSNPPAPDLANQGHMNDFNPVPPPPPPAPP